MIMRTKKKYKESAFGHIKMSRNSLISTNVQHFTLIGPAVREIPYQYSDSADVFRLVWGYPSLDRYTYFDSHGSIVIG